MRARPQGFFTGGRRGPSLGVKLPPKEGKVSALTRSPIRVSAAAEAAFEPIGLLSPSVSSLDGIHTIKGPRVSDLACGDKPPRTPGPRLIL